MEGRFNGGFLAFRFGGLIFGGAYTWRGLFSEFYGSLPLASIGTAATNIHAVCEVHFILFKSTVLLPQLKRLEKKGEGLFQWLHSMNASA